MELLRIESLMFLGSPRQGLIFAYVQRHDKSSYDWQTDGNEVGFVIETDLQAVKDY